MSHIEEAERAIDGIGRLALFDRKGGDGFGRDRAAAARSFVAYLLVLPAIALVIAVQLVQSEATSPGLFVTANIIGQIIAVAGFPLLLIPVLRLYRRPERWAWFISAYNWFNAARVVLSLGVLGLCITVLQGLGDWPLLMFDVYAWIIEAFMAEAILEVGGARAAAIVLLDAFFSFAVGAVANWIATGSFF
ncbi:MAG TPA: hypothetical protein VKS60_23495 [Stellaceae bacterium]|nr:hypothetical protein [Stellaceae bacterium]